MCRIYKTWCAWCAHEETDKIVCNSPRQLYGHLQTLQVKETLCKSCWLDPNKSAPGRERLDEAYLLVGSDRFTSITEMFARVERYSHLFPCENFPEFKGATQEDAGWLRTFIVDIGKVFLTLLSNQQSTQPSLRIRQLIVHLLQADAELRIAAMESQYNTPPSPSINGWTRSALLMQPVDKSTLEDLHCCICGETYDTGGLVDARPEEPVKLPCGHSFGCDCIARWLDDKEHGCPLCNRKFKSMQELYDNLRRTRPDLPAADFKPWWIKLIKGEEDISDALLAANYNPI